MKYTLENFQVNNWYMVYTEEQGQITGYLISKQHIEDVKNEADILVFSVRNNENYIFVNIEDITDYCFLESGEDGSKVRVFNPGLERYGIKQGATVTEIISKYMDDWDSYSAEEKEFLTNEIVGAMTGDNLADLITAYVNCRKNYNEECKKYIDMLDNQIEFMNRYGVFRTLMPDWLRKGYDFLIFDLFGYKLDTEEK